MMGAQLAKTQHRVLHGATGFWHLHSAFGWVLRYFVPYRDPVDSGHATGDQGPLRKVGEVPSGVSIGVELQRDRSSAGIIAALCVVRLAWITGTYGVLDYKCLVERPLRGHRTSKHILMPGWPFEERLFGSKGCWVVV